ncbi:hypothetical protein [Gordonia sp. CPCC 205333]|uniref:hypothetical protein n=1 Tax=Gordonia sp. CPCC 205333 TaxID=3140790 RepID=UPI003AF3D8CB
MSSARKKQTSIRREEGTPEAGDGTRTGVTPGPDGTPSKGVVVGFAVAALALIVAIIALAGFGYRAYDVYFNEKPAQSARDAAVDSAELAILNVLTIKTSDLKDWQQRIDSSLTGDARSQVTGDQISALTAQFQKGGQNAASLEARLVRSAPVEVNADEGTGKVLVYVNATSKIPNQAGVTKLMGFEVSVLRGEGDVWKANVIRSLDSLALTDQTGTDQTGTDQTGQAPAATTTPGGN